MSEERASQDESRREQERALRAAAPGPERGAARLAVVALERRSGQLDLAALALEEAIREGGPLDLAGAELARILAQDPREQGARRALACFAAVSVPGASSAPFPDVTHAALRVVQRATLFRSTFSSVPREAILALEPSILALAPGRTGNFGREKWSASLGRSIDDTEARALDALYGRLLGATRRRVVARLDTPGPLHEIGLERLDFDEGFELAFGNVYRGFLLGRSHGRHVLVHTQSGVIQRQVDVLEGVSVSPILVPSDTGAYAVGVDAQGELHAAYSSPHYRESPTARKRVGPGVSIAAACEHVLGLAVFLDGRALTITQDGRVSGEIPLPGLVVEGAASWRGSDIALLTRAGGRSEVVLLDSHLRAQRAPVVLPPLSPHARIAWPTADSVVVLDPPGSGHVVRPFAEKLAWSARLPETLGGLEVTATDGLEFVSFGRIESEWGQGEADVGIARWTRDGLGRHGPTVRVEVAPSGPIPLVKLACRGELLAVAYTGLEGVTVRFASLAPIAPTVPPAPEWTFAADEGDSLPAP